MDARGAGEREGPVGDLEFEEGAADALEGHPFRDFGEADGVGCEAVGVAVGQVSAGEDRGAELVDEVVVARAGVGGDGVVLAG
jgi:hypothetical protein